MLRDSELASAPQPADRRIVTAYDVAEQLGVCTGTVYLWDKRGVLPKSFKISSRRFWWASELEQWLSDGCPRREMETDR